MLHFFNKKSKSVFDLQSDFQPEGLEPKDDVFFDEALASHPHSAQEPNRSFVGPVISRGRFRLALIFVLTVFLIFVGKTASLQIFQGEKYRALAEENRTRHRVIPSQRGVIYDRNGEILAKNDPAFQIVTSKKLLPGDATECDQLLSRLALDLSLNVDELRTIVASTEKDDEQILLSSDLAYDSAMKFLALNQNYPGLDLELGSHRTYVTDQIPSLSHILGYTGIISEEEYPEIKAEGYRRFDLIGKQGIEKYYESILRGTFGQEIVEVDALGHAERIVSKTDPIDGANLTLTIDADLQKYIETVLINRMKGTGTQRASVIMMEPKSGEILAMVSWPAFDANSFTGGIDQETYQALLKDENLPLFGRAFAGEFPSGSTIKPVYAAGALMDGIITPTTTFLSTGGISVGPWFFPDWRAGGHGLTNVYHAIEDSVNTFFYMIGGGNETFTGMGIERMMQHAADFGFGSQSGLDIAGEADGFLPSKEWKLSAKGEIWYIGDTYHVAIGQGDFLVTPLQIARATAVFANGGNLITPHLNKNLQTAIKNIVPADVVKVIADAMHRTVTQGSARSMNTLSVSSAGKTGTAQWSTTRPNHSWYTGFAPFDDPQVVITVLIEEGADSNLAVPVAHDILEWWFAQNGNLENSNN